MTVGPNRVRRAITLGLLSGITPRFSRPFGRSHRVIVVGAGFGGATCAKYLRTLSPHTEVLLIDRRRRFLTGPFSNLVIAGLRTESSISRDLTAIGRAHDVTSLCAEIVDLDPVRLEISASDGRSWRADRIVLSPGVAMRWDLVEGLDATTTDAMPHAWLGDFQVPLLRDRLRNLPDGATVVIGAPPNPYRCPPGPYERASLMAHAFKSTGRSRAKILVADAKDDFSKSALFKLEWDTLYPGMIDWIPRSAGGDIGRVNTASGEIWPRGSATPLRAALASIVPAQRAGDLALRAGLVDESNWCPVRADDFESLRHPGIHVIGDASIAAPMPKSGFAANSQAKLCASAIAARLRGAAPPEARLLNTCYSLVSDHEAISVSGYYGVAAGRLSALAEGMSPLSGDDELRQREARQAFAWYDGVTRDTFGRP